MANDIKFTIGDDEDESPRSRGTDIPRVRGTSAKPGRLGNEALAAQATEVLLQVNGAICLTAMTFGLKDTASAVADREAVFKEQVYNALLVDPNLCRAICRVQGAGGIMSLVMAYAMLGISVAPVAMQEFQTKKQSGELGFKLPGFSRAKSEAA